MLPEKGVLVQFQFKDFFTSDKFNDLKMRFASSLALLMFACVFLMANLQVSSLILLLVYAVLFYEWHTTCLKNKKLIDVMVFIFITLGTVSFGFINLMRYEDGLFGGIVAFVPMIFVLSTAILSDTGAYFTGRIIGGYCPFPQISPSKTLSGYLGGLCLGGMSPLVFALIIKVDLIFGQIFILLGVGLLLSVASMAGDLLQSHFKRKNNVKDTGTILPGHGGLFDRFDGILGASLMLFLISLVMMWWS